MTKERPIAKFVRWVITYGKCIINCHWHTFEGGNFGSPIDKASCDAFPFLAKTMKNFVEIHALDFALQKYAFLRIWFLLERKYL